MYMSVYLNVHLCSMCMPGAQQCQKRVSDHLELALQTFVSYHVSSGTHTQVP